MENIECVIGGVELSRSEVEQYYNEKRYIVCFSGVFQINFSQANNRFYGQLVIAKKGISKRGRFYAMKAKEINDILNEKILVEN